MEDSENSEQEERRRERKREKNKILKGSPSVEEIKNKSNQNLDQIEEEKEASIKSVNTGAAPKKDELLNNLSDVRDSENKSNASRAKQSNAGAYPPAGGNVPGAGFGIKFENEVNEKLEDMKEDIQSNKDSITEMESKLEHLKNDMLTKMAGAAMSASSPTKTSKGEASSADTEALKKKMKDIEETIKNMDKKF